MSRATDFLLHDVAAFIERLQIVNNVILATEHIQARERIDDSLYVFVSYELS